MFVSRIPRPQTQALYSHHLLLSFLSPFHNLYSPPNLSALQVCPSPSFCLHTAMALSSRALQRLTSVPPPTYLPFLLCPHLLFPSPSLPSRAPLYSHSPPPPPTAPPLRGTSRRRASAPASSLSAPLPRSQLCAVHARSSLRRQPFSFPISSSSLSLLKASYHAHAPLPFPFPLCLPLDANVETHSPSHSPSNGGECGGSCASSLN